MQKAREYSEEEIYGMLEPYIAEWFRRKYGHFTPPQRYAIVEIAKKRNILICAPTGSGKTFACFLGILNYLCRLNASGKLEDRVYCLYISPLKALGNDIRRNLEEPLSEISEVLRERQGVELGIRIAVRTGDTTQAERQKMLKKPPHILITTPETAAIVLNAPKFREHLRKLEFVVVDEIHELADSKRGAHLSITLERLQHFCENEFVRIGMSATISPLEEVAKFLVGCEYDEKGELKPRPCLIADVSFAKKLDVRVVSPGSFSFSPQETAETEDAWDLTSALYERVREFVERHRSTLVFTNTRSGAERVSYKLKRLLDRGEDVGTHHSSLSREVRLAVEEGLKAGRMKAVVCSSSLELGIDIGALDFCVLIGSPKSSTRLIQRVGRSGHSLKQTAKGCLVVTDLDDLVECAVLAKRASERKLDRVQIVGCALDVLAQHLVGFALERKWSVEEVFNIVRKAYPYRNLRKEQLISVLRYLSGKYSELESVKVYPKIWFDEKEGVFGRKKNVRGIYMAHIGTIPSESSVQVYQKSPRKWIGEIDEPFLERLERGDIFVLGGKTYKFLHADGLRAFVEPCEGLPPTIPSWVGEMLPLEYDSALDVGRFRAEMERRMEDAANKHGKNWRNAVKSWLKREYRLEDEAAEDIIAYFERQKMFLGVIPTHKRIVVEHFTDDLHRKNIIFHALFGRRTLDALSRAFAFALSRKFNMNVSVTLNDNGFILRVPREISVRDAVEMLKNEVRSENVEELLRKSVQNTELFKRRFRHCAVRGLMVLKQYKGFDIGVGKQQRSSSSILEIVRKIEGFPIVEETFREILEEVFDIEHVKEVLRGIERGEIEIKVVETPFPSPFAHNLVALQASDVILMESRRELLLQLHRKVLEYIKGGAESSPKI